VNILSDPPRLRVGTRLVVLALLAAVLGVSIEAQRATPAEAQRRPFVIASMGDSYAAGQGTPNVNASGCNVLSNLVALGQTIISVLDGGNLNVQFCDTPAQWSNRQCHRSNASPHLLASNALQTVRPDLAIEFFSVACSGATIRKPDLLGGLLTAYRGEEPGAGPDLAPQVDQLVQRFGDRQIDALIIGIGGNDIGFASTFANCITPLVACDGSSDTITAFLDAINGLDASYDALADAISRRLKVGNIYMVEYPRLWRDARNENCDNNPLALDPMTAHLTRDENNFIEQGHTLLNQRLRAAVQRHAGKGWIYVDGIVGAYDRHGYCMPDGGRFINRTFDAIEFQGQVSGMLHPNRAGYEVISDRILTKLSGLLVAPAAPSGLGVQNVQGTNAANPSVSRLTWSDNSANDEVTFQIAARRVGATTFEFDVVRRNVTSFQIAQQIPGPVLPTPTCIPAPANPCPPPPATTTTDYFVRACKTLFCSPWSAGLRTIRNPNQLPQPQGSSPAGTAPSNDIMVIPAPLIPGATVGVLELNPSALSVAADAVTTLNLSWTVPEPMVWRDLESVELVIGGPVPALRLRFDEASNTLSLLDDASGTYGEGVPPGSEATLETPYAVVYAAGIIVQGSGPAGRSVTMSVPVSFNPVVDGSDLLVSVIARADDGREEVDSAGAIFVGIRPAPADDASAGEEEGGE
jgi:hypothetical protein